MINFLIVEHRQKSKHVKTWGLRQNNLEFIYTSLFIRNTDSLWFLFLCFKFILFISHAA